MDGRGDGLLGVGFLFALIGPFLLVVSLKATGHVRLAAEFGLAGSAILAALTGRFLLRKWRNAPAFDEDGNVQFCGAVFLLSAMVLALGLARVSGISLSKVMPLVPIVLGAAAIPVRTFARKLRRLP